METLFPLGQILATPGAIQAAHEAGDNLFLFIFRHAAGDWGDLSPDDMKANAQALKEGTRLLSAYHLQNGTKSGSLRKRKTMRARERRPQFCCLRNTNLLSE